MSTLSLLYRSSKKRRVILENIEMLIPQCHAFIIMASVFPQDQIYKKRYRIAGNFRGRKLSRISRFYSHPRNELLGMPHPLCDQFTFGESFLSEMLPFYRSVKVFSLEIFLLYGSRGWEQGYTIIINSAASSKLTQPVL